MSRFTTSILLATALLGILLWIVVSMAVDFARAPEEPLQLENVIEYDPALPRLETRAELISYLTTNGLDGRALVTNFERWLAARGYPLGVLNAPLESDELIADASATELLVLAANGDIDALHALAESSLRDGQPLAAIEWYDQAIINGSLYAMGRRADLLNTLSDPALAAFRTAGEWPAELERIADDRVAGLQAALSWSLAAVMAGGFAIVNPNQAGRISNLTAAMDSVSIRLGCDAAQENVLEAATARRARGGAVFSTESPLFALTVANPAEYDPCPVPIVPLVSMEHCEVFEFVNPGPNQLMAAWVCPY